MERFSSSAMESGSRSEPASLATAKQLKPIQFFGVTEIAYIETWSGPLPPPYYLSEYEKFSPGFAQKVMEEFVNERHHQRSMDILGINRAFLLAISLICLIMIIVGLAVFLALNGHDGVAAFVAGGSILGGGSLVIMVTAFLRPHKNKTPPPSELPQTAKGEK
ncbi:MAG: DUF2335 domain-containing protein [Candidatus Symbiobacter sp.]|nr:DUF2335 domain-containing protein [Candidatus Symbiobacter sp.]